MLVKIAQLILSPLLKKNMPKAVCFRHCVLCVSVWGEGVFNCFVYQRNGLRGDAFFASFKSEAFGGGGFDVDVVGAYVHDGCQFFSHGLDVW